MYRIFLVALLALGLSGCIPLATLRTAAPAKGTEITAGGSLLVPLGAGSSGALGLPYIALARGDGETEFNLSSQFGIRGGIKQKISEGLSFDGGLTVSAIPLLGDGLGSPFALDGGLILGWDAFYFSPRVQWLGFSINNSFNSGFLYQLAAGYSDPGFIVELGTTFSGQGGGMLLGISAAARF